MNVPDDERRGPRSVQAGGRMVRGRRLPRSISALGADGGCRARSRQLGCTLQGSLSTPTWTEILAGPGALDRGISSSLPGHPRTRVDVRLRRCRVLDFKTTRLANPQTWRSSARAPRQKLHPGPRFCWPAWSKPERFFPRTGRSICWVIPEDGLLADQRAYEEPVRPPGRRGADRLTWARERMAAARPCRPISRTPARVLQGQFFSLRRGVQGH